MWKRDKNRIPAFGGMTDIHCHLLPGVDDGAKDMQEALALLKAEYGQGVHRVILTPHYRPEYFDTPRSQIRAQYAKLCQCAADEDLKIEIRLGCEFYREADMIPLLEQESAYRMAETSYILLEFSSRDTMMRIRNGVLETLAAGYRPIIAHAERYPALYEDGAAAHLVHAGAYIQLNAGSLLGKNGRACRKFCTGLLQNGCVHFVASDAHNMRTRLPDLGDCAAWLIRKFGEKTARRLLQENPARLLEDQPL